MNIMTKNKNVLNNAKMKIGIQKQKQKNMKITIFKQYIDKKTI